ncbi:MAG: hypothetical protein JOZ15_09350, partial [Acidobacteria bacterium]|nr:hypothetical protein [Acidobacteriota bacterium]
MLRARTMKILLAALALLLGACASGPAPAPRESAATPAAAPPPTAATHICNPQARFVTFASLGVPEGEHAIDLVSADDYDYLLFAPARLVRLSLRAGKV